MFICKKFLKFIPNQKSSIIRLYDITTYIPKFVNIHCHIVNIQYLVITRQKFVFVSATPIFQTTAKTSNCTRWVLKPHQILNITLFTFCKKHSFDYKEQCIPVKVNTLYVHRITTTSVNFTRISLNIIFTSRNPIFKNQPAKRFDKTWNE